MTKTEIRRLYRNRQSSLSDSERAGMSSQIARLFFDRFGLDHIRFLHCFISIGRFGEVDTSYIFKRLWSDFPFIQTVVPRTGAESGEMDSLRFTAETELAENAWGISEPTQIDAVDVANIDLALVPLICIDRSGHRVGYGKGYYDRLLSKSRPDCLKVGLSYFPPVDAIEDVNQYDVPMDACITPETIYRFISSPH